MELPQQIRGGEFACGFPRLQHGDGLFVDPVAIDRSWREEARGERQWSVDSWRDRGKPPAT
jgi:hypothetical protein